MMKEEFVANSLIHFQIRTTSFVWKKKALIHEEGHQNVRVPAIFDKIW